MAGRVLSSPDGRHEARLVEAGEIRFGPPYFSLWLDKRALRGRVFGESCLWSPDSRFFGVEEWLTTAEADGPRTQLVVFDVQEGRECVVSGARGGFIEPKEFAGGMVIYTKRYLGRGYEQEFESPFLTLDRWQPFGTGSRAGEKLPDRADA